MKELERYKAIAARTKNNPIEIDGFELAEVIDRLLVIVETQAKTIQELNSAYMQEVIKERYH
jgi:hypothetical protein